MIGWDSLLAIALLPVAIVGLLVAAVLERGPRCRHCGTPTDREQCPHCGWVA
jgi:hypothetical protein